MDGGINLQGFELAYWWVLPALILVGIVTVGGFLFYQSKARKRAAGSKTVLVANSFRVRETAAYQKALKTLWIKVVAFGAVLSVAAAVAAFGASRPVSIDTENPEKYNRDVVLCLDASSSMFDVDIEILQRFDELADGFKGERVSLTIFNATGLQVFPLTDDYDYVKENLSKTIDRFQKGYNDPETSSYLASTLGREEGASLVGDGLYGCSLSFDYQDDENRSRSIILATDNVVNGKELVPLDEAAQLAAERNIRVYGINPGSRGSGISYVPDSSLTSMEESVEATGGKFFLLNNSAAVSTIVDEISDTETSIVEGSPLILRKDNPEAILYILSALIFGIFGFAVWRKI
jgi:Ca-activated chloride channel family protein